VALNSPSGADVPLRTYSTNQPLIACTLPHTHLPMCSYAKLKPFLKSLKANFWKSVIAYKVFVRFTQMDQKQTTAQQQQP